MANTKITASNIADDAITSAHIDSTSTGMTLADLTVTGTEPTVTFIDSDGTQQNTTLNQSGGNFFIKARDNTSNAGIVFAGNASGSFDEYARFTSAGKLGIGSTNPSQLLVVNAADGVLANEYVAAFVNAEATDGQSFGVSINAGSNANDVALNITTHDGGTVLGRLKGDGGFLLPTGAATGMGTDSPFTRLHIKNTGWSSGSPYGSVALIEGNNTNDANWGHLHITDTTTANGNGGSIRFGTGAASALNPFSGIQGVAEGTSHGGLGFYTRPSGGTSTERMRIKSDGTVGVGTDSPSNQFTIYRSGSETTASLHSNGQSELRFVANNAANTWIQAGTGPSSSQVIINLTGMYGTSNTMTIDTPNARVGINTSSPSSKLHVASGAQNDYSYYQTCGQGTYYHGFGNSFYFHHFQSGASAGFYWGSACVANGGFSAYSDERLKENITTIDNALDKVALMDGITFTWKDTEKRGNGKQFGVTAQNMLEVDSALPVLSGDAEATQEDIDNPDVNTEFYTFDYARLTPYFIEAIKELKTKLEAAEARITELEG